MITVYGILFILVLLATALIFYTATKLDDTPDRKLKKFHDYYADIEQHSLSRNQIDMMREFLYSQPPKTKENAKGRIVIADGGSILYRTSTLRSLIQRGYLKRTGGKVELAYVTRKIGSSDASPMC